LVILKHKTPQQVDKVSWSDVEVDVFKVE